MEDIELSALPVYEDRYIKRGYSDKVYTNFGGLNVLQDGVESESFTMVSIDSLLVYESKCYLQVYLDNCAYNIADQKLIDYFDDDFFQTDGG